MATFRILDDMSFTQTIYGELISLESNNYVMGLAMFILGHLLWNLDIAAEFRPKVLHLYRDGKLIYFIIYSLCDRFYFVLFF